jgi:hypothetical protein
MSGALRAAPKLANPAPLRRHRTTVQKAGINLRRRSLALMRPQGFGRRTYDFPQKVNFLILVSPAYFIGKFPDVVEKSF